MPCPLLPLELLVLIIDNVDSSSEEGRQSLRNLSLANNALRSICQERLFRTVELYYVTSIDVRDGTTLLFSEDEDNTGRRFLDTLARSPHIGPFVRYLEITTLQLDPMEFTPPPKSNSESASFSLYSIVPALPNLKGFSVSKRPPFWGYAVGEQMEACLSSLASFVTQLELSSLPTLPTSIFSGCRNLRDLSVSSLELGEGDITSRDSMQKVKLRKLELGFCFPADVFATTCFNTPQSPLDISELRSLSLSPIRFLYTTSLNVWLPLCFSALEHLKFAINFRSMFRVYSPPLDLILK